MGVQNVFGMGIGTPFLDKETVKTTIEAVFRNTCLIPMSTFAGSKKTHRDLQKIEMQVAAKERGPQIDNLLKSIMTNKGEPVENRRRRRQATVYEEK